MGATGGQVSVVATAAQVPVVAGDGRCRLRGPRIGVRFDPRCARGGTPSRRSTMPRERARARPQPSRGQEPRIGAECVDRRTETVAAPRVGGDALTRLPMQAQRAVCSPFRCWTRSSLRALRADRADLASLSARPRQRDRRLVRVQRPRPDPLLLRVQRRRPDPSLLQARASVPDVLRVGGATAAMQAREVVGASRATSAPAPRRCGEDPTPATRASLSEDGECSQGRRADPSAEVAARSHAGTSRRPRRCPRSR